MSATLAIGEERAALAELDPAYRELYTLHAVERLTAAQIAERLSLQPLIVGPLLGRMRKKLREALERRAAIPEAL